MGIFNMQEQWDEKNNERSKKLLADISSDSMDALAKRFVEQLSKDFSKLDVDIPRPVKPMPEVSRDMDKLDLMRILIKQNFMMMKQLDAISKKLDNLK